MTKIIAQPLEAEIFSPYGDVIEKEGAECFAINNGLCIRLVLRAGKLAFDSRQTAT